MPAKQYVVKPVEAYTVKLGDKTFETDMQQLGITIENEQLTGQSGNTFTVSDGDYITVDAAGDARCLSKDYFEQRYVAK